MEDEKVEGFYQERGKEIVDMMFDKGYFREDVSREGMKQVEDFLAWYIQTQCNSAVKVALLTKRIKERK